MVSTPEFLDIRFPEEIAFGATGGPRFNTSIAITRGGNEVRNANWAKSRMKWNVSHGIKNQTEYDELVAFFYVVRGQKFGFRFKDHTDFNQNIPSPDTPMFIARGDGVTTEFQLIKRYTFADQFYDRDITRPIPGTVRIFLSSDTDDFIENFTDWNVNFDTGKLTFDVTTPLDPIDEIWAIYDFDVPVRFDSDEVDISLDDYQNYNWPNIDVIELRDDGT